LSADLTALLRCLCSSDLRILFTCDFMLGMTSFSVGQIFQTNRDLGRGSNGF
jgi:hypothetical protein